MSKLYDLRSNGVSLTSTFSLCLVVLATTVCCDLSPAVPQTNKPTPEIDTCKTDDLNHSILVECDVTSCARPSTGSGQDEHNVEWPSQSGQIIHIYSTRAGQRLTQVTLPNLNYEEDDRTRMLDINTTLYIKTNQNLQQDEVNQRKIAGFGGSIDFVKLERALQGSQFERLFGLIFDDMFGRTTSSANLNLLRLQIDFKLKKNPNLQTTLVQLNDQLGNRVGNSGGRILLLIEFANLKYSDSHLELDSNITQALTNIEIWAISIDETEFNLDLAEKEAMIRRIREILPNVSLFFSVLPFDAPDFVNSINETPKSKFNGLLIRSRSSVPYNYLEHVRQHASDKIRIMTIGRSSSKTKNLGDWQNAQESAIELMNHLKRGSNGYIEDESVVDAYDLVNPNDASLYSLHQDHGLHMRGPKFYAIGHFSRYLPVGSLPLETELFTQPNMFAAHYSAFITPDRQFITGIILNENEHLLPFRIAIDRRITIATNLEPKSFNTFLIKLI